MFPAEVASLLIRNVSYEGPALRKQLAKAQQLQQEMSRREVECQSSATDLRERYYTACKQYGIKVSARGHRLVVTGVFKRHSGSHLYFLSQGENVSRELQALVKDLPAVLKKVGEDAAKLEKHIQLYTAFTDFVCGW